MDKKKQKWLLALALFTFNKQLAATNPETEEYPAKSEDLRYGYDNRESPADVCNQDVHPSAENEGQKVIYTDLSGNKITRESLIKYLNEVFELDKISNDNKYAKKLGELLSQVVDEYADVLKKQSVSDETEKAETERRKLAAQEKVKQYEAKMEQKPQKEEQKPEPKRKGKKD